VKLGGTGIGRKLLAREEQELAERYWQGRNRNWQKDTGKGGTGIVRNILPREKQELVERYWQGRKTNW